MPWRKFIVLLFLFRLSPVSSQSISFDNYSTKDGLISEEVYNVYQDKDGYVWAFTNNGAMKFNGREFKQVLKNLPFNESFFYTMFENEAGEKWVANSKARIYNIVNDSAFIQKGTEEISELLRKQVNEILQLAVDDSANLYVRTKQANYKFFKQGSDYKCILLNERIPSHIHYIFQEINEEVFPIFSYVNPEKLNSNFFERDSLSFIIRPSDSERLYRIESRTLSGPRHVKKFDRNIYLCLYDKLIKIDSNRTIKTIPLNAVILNFTKDKNNHLWVACYNHGLYELDQNDSIINRYFPDLTINDVLADNQNGLWISTPGSGLFHCANLNNKYFSNGHPLQESISFIKKIDDELFVATMKGRVYRKKKNSRNFEEFFNHSHTINSIYLVNDQLVLSTTYEVIYLNREGTIKDRVPVPNVHSILSLTDTVLFSHRKGIGLILKNRTVKRIDLNEKIYAVAIKNNVILVATEDGLYEYVKNTNLENRNENAIVYATLEQPEYLLNSKGSVVTSIVDGISQNTWFTSRGSGLFELDNQKRLKNYTVQDGLPSNIINDITFEKRGFIFISTNKGLYLSRASDVAHAVWKRIYPGDVRKISVFNNNLYLHSRKGLTILDLNSLNETDKIRFHLSDVYVNSTIRNTKDLVSLEHDENNFEFVFDIVSLGETYSSVSYVLKGAIRDSGRSNNSSIILNNLEHGRYYLEVWPNIYKGRLKKKVIELRIKPAFWQTRIFITISMIFAGLIVLVLARAGIKIYKSRLDRKNAAEKLILEYKLIALKAQVNPHFLSNCLTALQNLVLDNQLEKATTYIAKFGLLVRQILNFSTSSLVSLREELQIAVLYMELEQLRFENKFNFEISVSDELKQNEIFVPALILNPIVENAIWHGLLPLGSSRHPKIWINVRKEEGRILIIVEDNGVGRQNDNQLGNTRESKGINLTEQRLANLNYLYSTEKAYLEYSDVSSITETKMGTRVTISLPDNVTPKKNG